MNASLASNLILRELRAIQREIGAYPDDEAPWREAPGISNPGGTLAMHCAGNLQYYVGTLLGGTGYQRDRAAEFASRGLSRAAVVAELDHAAQAVETTLAALPDSALSLPFPEPLRGLHFRTDNLLAHLSSHVAYHLGQIDYHRRLTTGDATTVGTMALDELLRLE